MLCRCGADTRHAEPAGSGAPPPNHLPTHLHLHLHPPTHLHIQPQLLPLCGHDAGEVIDAAGRGRKQASGRRKGGGGGESGARRREGRGTGTVAALGGGQPGDYINTDPHTHTHMHMHMHIHIHTYAHVHTRTAVHAHASRLSAARAVRAAPELLCELVEHSHLALVGRVVHSNLQWSGGGEGGGGGGAGAAVGREQRVGMPGRGEWRSVAAWLAPTCSWPQSHSTNPAPLDPHTCTPPACSALAHTHQQHT